MSNNEFGNSTIKVQNSTEETGFTKTTSRIIAVLLILSAISGFIPSPITGGGIIIGGIILIISIYREKAKYYKYAATVVVAWCTISFLFFVLIVVPNTHAREKRAKAHTVVYNLRTIGKVLQRYADDHKGCLPPTEKWCDVLLQYDKNLAQNDFKHPENPEIVIAFNKNLGGVQFANIPRDTVVLFETQGIWGLSGDEDTIQTANSATARVLVLLANMEIKSYWVKHKAVQNWRNQFVPVRWKP